VAVLPDHQDTLVLVECDDANRSGMPHDITYDDPTVRHSHLVGAH
jgi:hypothetical protein